MDALALHETIPVSAISVSVHIIPPGGDRPYRTLATCGVSEEPLEPPPKKRGQRYVELLIRLPADWQVDPQALERDERAIWPVHWLRMCAHRIHDQRLWLGEGHALEAPRKIPADWRFTGFLLVPSELPAAKAKGRREVTFYSVRPIMAAELRVAQERGAGSLIDLWKQANRPEIHDENREPLV